MKVFGSEQPRRLSLCDDPTVHQSRKTTLTKCIGYEVQRALVLLHNLAIQSSEVEPVQDIVLVDLGKVLLAISCDSYMDLRCPLLRETTRSTFSAVSTNTYLHTYEVE